MSKMSKWTEPNRDVPDLMVDLENRLSPGGSARLFVLDGSVSQLHLRVRDHGTEIVQTAEGTDLVRTVGKMIGAALRRLRLQKDRRISARRRSKTHRAPLRIDDEV